MAQAKSAVRRKCPLSEANENPCRNKVIVALDLGPVSDSEKWPNVSVLQRRPVHTISDPGGNK